jgi:alkanesulfonate monooxygenase SsuD/methylene tetrahydromethanopterin reductase-like flavin-dependent oxidoreductase (luciferase family)
VLVKFGLIAQMQAPKPWPEGENVDHRIHWDTLAEAVLAEKVGFDYWATEHHFYEEIAHSSAPEVFLAALAARTTRMRLELLGAKVLPRFQDAS